MTFGEFIKREREQFSFGVEEAADLLGVNRATLYQWETNKKRPSKKNVRKIAELYAVKVHDLVNLL